MIYVLTIQYSTYPYGNESRYNSQVPRRATPPALQHQSARAPGDVLIRGCVWRIAGRRREGEGGCWCTVLL